MIVSITSASPSRGSIRRQRCRIRSRHLGIGGGVPAAGDADAAAHHALRVGEVAGPFRAAADFQK